MTGEEISGGWVAISGGVVDAVGGPGSEPRAAETLSARGCLVTPGLVNAHHHMFQNLTRCFAPVLNSELMSWAGTQSDMWVRLDEEAAYVSAWVGLAELALGGCTLTTDDLYAHPRPKLIDAELAARTRRRLPLRPVPRRRRARPRRRADLPGRARAGPRHDHGRHRAADRRVPRPLAARDDADRRRAVGQLRRDAAA